MLGDGRDPTRREDPTGQGRLRGVGEGQLRLFTACGGVGAEGEGARESRVLGAEGRVGEGAAPMSAAVERLLAAALGFRSGGVVHCGRED